MTEEPIPAIEWSPPYSMDFVAHLHAGCYSDDVTPELLAAVRSDHAGERMLDVLTITQMELRVLGQRDRSR